MLKSPATLKLFRKLHLYTGVFISPALVFFACTGALQTFSLHETVRGSDYKPSLMLMTIAQIHKNATWKLQPHKPGADQPADKPKVERQTGGANSAKTSDSPQGVVASPHEAVAVRPAAAPAVVVPAPAVSKRLQHLPLKVFFLLVSLGLLISTITGIYMTYKYDRHRVLVTGLLVAGVVIPMILLPL